MLREKSLIISITLLFTVASIIFSLSIQNKFNKFKSEIIIKEPPRSFFYPLNVLLINQIIKGILKIVSYQSIT